MLPHIGAEVSLLGIEVSVTGCWRLAFKCNLHLGRWGHQGSPSSAANHTVQGRAEAGDKAVSLSPIHMKLHLYVSIWLVLPF